MGQKKLANGFGCVTMRQMNLGVCVKYIQSYIVMRFVRLFTIAIGCCLLYSAADGAYHPEVNIAPEQKAEVRKGVSALKALGRKYRQAVIAEKLGLLFMPSGEAAYSSTAKTSVTEKVRFYPPATGCHYISTDGKEYDLRTIIDEKDRDPKKRQAWIQAKQSIYTAGDAAVFAELKKEVTDMVLVLARRHYMRMPAKARYAFRAMLEENVAGAEPVRVKQQVDGMDVNMTVMEYPGAAKFSGKDGHEYAWAEIMDELKDKKLDRGWKQMLWCCELIGKKDILAMMAEQEKASKK